MVGTYILYGAYAIADKFAATFKDFPPVQKPNSFTIDQGLAMMAAQPFFAAFFRAATRSAPLLFLTSAPCARL